MHPPTQEAPYLLYEADDIFVVYKPSGVLVHPASGDAGPDLCTWLDAAARAGMGIPRGTKPAHRLDGGTSGLVLCAADRGVRGEIGTWFANGEVKKTYIALVHGRLRDRGCIERALQDARRGHPLAAVTRYRCVDRFGAFSLVEVYPETGRKHQIRRHFHGLGHAVVGDRRYRLRRPRKVPADPGRLWLHAASLCLPDGTELECPLPQALKDHISALQALTARES